MAVENLGEISGLARLDAIQRGDSVEPIRVPEIIREVIPTNPTNKQRRSWKRAWPGLQQWAQQELSQ